MAAMIAAMNSAPQRRTLHKCRYVIPCSQRPPSRSSLLRWPRHRPRPCAMPTRATSNRSTPIRSTKPPPSPIIGHVYEGLVTRDKDLKIVPALAESWETPEPTRWRFHLRKNVKFHNGDPFTADDVMFSADRVRAKGSNLQTNVAADAKFVKIDDYTVDLMLTSPNPILHFAMGRLVHHGQEMVRGEQRRRADPGLGDLAEFCVAQRQRHRRLSSIESHQPGVKTVFKANPNWWRKPEHNLKEIIFTPIGSDATRVAALLSGEVDVIEPVPIQDISRVDSSPECPGAEGPGTANHLSRHGPGPRRIAVFEHQGQESVQGHQRARGVLQGDRHRADQDPRDARPFDAVGADDRAAAVQAVGRLHPSEIRSRRRQEAA